MKTFTPKKKESSRNKSGFLNKQEKVKTVRNKPDAVNDMNPDIRFSNIKITDSPGGFGATSSVQPKLKIGKPNDKFEQEADRMAEQVMNVDVKPIVSGLHNNSVLSNQIHRQCADCEEEEILMTKVEESYNIPEIQKQSEDELEEEELMMKRENQSAESQTVDRYHVIPESRGAILSEEARSFFEKRFGHDFSRVRVHHDTGAGNAAAAIHAKAYTLGNNIVFGKGHYNANNREGRKLLAHELTHVIQQGKAPKINGNGNSFQNQSVAPVIQKKNGPSKPKSNEGIKKALKAQKMVWDDLRAFFPDDVGKLAGTGFSESVGYLQTDLTEDKEGPSTKAVPIINAGPDYLKEEDEDKRKEKLGKEVDKINEWRVDTFRVENIDLKNEKVKHKIQDLKADKKLELMGKLEEKKEEADNDQVIEYIKKVMQSTPIVEGATARDEGGYELQVDNIKIIVLPDKYNSSEASAGGAVTKIDRIDNITDMGKTPAWKSEGGEITELEFIPSIPEIKFTIQTHYSSGSNPRDISGYGVGTRAKDESEAEKSLGFHEGSHGLEFIKSIKSGTSAHKYPEYPFETGDPAAGVNAAHQQYRNEVKEFRDMINEALKEHIQKVDCVGKTIEEYHKENKTSTKVHCHP